MMKMCWTGPIPDDNNTAANTLLRIHNQQDPNSGNSHVATESAEVSGRQRRFRALPVIGAARRWLSLTGKV